ncbi:hypothetical protein AAG570_010906 [Ranatra chinensis]|uniref:FYVE-type domain-containing protein n=1 Tax=Ranatra chinensis TaxID=642074 RepID=A0ABD0Z5D1_9HEMI
MESMDCNSIESYRTDEDSKRNLPSMPDITLTSEFTSLKLGAAESDENLPRSFLLIDGKEYLKVSCSENFVAKLGCSRIGDPMQAGNRVKVVSIFGNTGDGKSHTMNHTFFEGEEVFHTSDEQESCTLGVWAAYDQNLKVICLDTEGLLGSTCSEKQRTRLLLKVLAVSDVVIYRTRSERLHRDMFTFLGWASRAFNQHFQSALQSKRGPGGRQSGCELGPAVIIFHETRHTRPLLLCGINSAEDILRSRFNDLKLDIEAFSSLRYVGIQTLEPPTNYDQLRKALITELTNTTVRSPRDPAIVYTTLKLLNDRFSGEMCEQTNLFPDEYFTCPGVCLSCSARCQYSMGHLTSSAQPHFSSKKCRYQHQYENIVYICKQCYKNGDEVIVTPRYGTSTEGSWFGLAKYAWSGYVIECPNCGEIYRSRQYWYGNSPPDVAAVRTDIHHVWPGVRNGQNSQNSAQRVLDSMNYLTEAVVSVSAQPTKLLGSWVADQVAPKYWRPNCDIKSCSVCSEVFVSGMTKHHCRACGEGVCEKCSNNSRPVPDKGWDYPVRVCDICFEPNASAPLGLEDVEITARKVSEAVVNTITSVASILEYPKSVIKESARPSYWVPDSEARECCVCSSAFSQMSGSVSGKPALHHCRDCGGAVCPECSTSRLPVPHRGWSSPVRVCDGCAKKSS